MLLGLHHTEGQFPFYAAGVPSLVSSSDPPPLLNDFWYEEWYMLSRSLGSARDMGMISRRMVFLILMSTWRSESCSVAAYQKVRVKNFWDVLLPMSTMLAMAWVWMFK